MASEIILRTQGTVVGACCYSPLQFDFVEQMKQQESACRDDFRRQERLARKLLCDRLVRGLRSSQLQESFPRVVHHTLSGSISYFHLTLTAVLYDAGQQHTPAHQQAGISWMPAWPCSTSYALPCQRHLQVSSHLSSYWKLCHPHSSIRACAERQGQLCQPVQ